MDFHSLKYLIPNKILPKTTSKKGITNAVMPKLAKIKIFPNQSPNFPKKLEDFTLLSNMEPN